MQRLLLPFLFVLIVHAVKGQADIPLQASRADTLPVYMTAGDSIRFFIGRTISIVGPVINITSQKREDGISYYFDLFKRWPDNPFTVVVFREHVAFFMPVEQYLGKTVRLTGKVRRFLDKKTGLERFSIILRKPDQIEIIK